MPSLAPRLPLLTFLSRARNALTSTLAQSPSSTPYQPLTFVVGNESADLDSLCSAIVLSYFRSLAVPSSLHVPVANIPRADLVLRPELAAVLRRAAAAGGSDGSSVPEKLEELLVTLDDLVAQRPDGGDAAPTLKSAKWFLVDHNALTGRLAERFGPEAKAGSVVGCIDHHVDEVWVPGQADLLAATEGTEGADGMAGLRVIRPSGSCMSLVILEACRDVWERSSTSATADEKDKKVSASAAAAASDRELALVALAPILDDTHYLTAKDKTTDDDVAAVEYLEGKLGLQAAAQEKTQNSMQNYDRKSYWGDIARIKTDISRLSFRDILRKDYKRWANGGLHLGIAAIHQNFDYLLQKQEHDNEGFLDALRAWGKEEGLDIIVAMTATTGDDNHFHRELLVWALTAGGAAVAREFEEKGKDKFQLVTWRDGKLDAVGNDGDDIKYRRAWMQQNLAYSRKQVAPALREAMKAVGPR